MELKKDFLNLYSRLNAPLVDGDVVEVINPKLKTFGKQGIVEHGEASTNYFFNDENVGVFVKGLLDNKPNNSVYINVKNLKFISGRRDTMQDIFGYNPVYIAEKKNKNSEIGNVSMLTSVVDNDGNIIKGFFCLNRYYYTNPSPMVCPLESDFINDVLSDDDYKNKHRFIITKEQYDEFISKEKNESDERNTQYVIRYETHSHENDINEVMMSHCRMVLPHNYMNGYQQSFKVIPDSIIVNGSELKDKVNELINNGVKAKSIEIFKIDTKVDFSLDVDIKFN